MLSARVRLVLAASALLLLAGCAQVDNGEEGEHVAAMTMNPGTTASTLFLANNTDADPATANITVDEPEGLNVMTPDPLQSDGNGTLAGWLTVEADEDIDEDRYDITVNLDVGEDEPEEHHLTVTVEDPEDPLEEGETAVLRFSAVTQDDELAFTNNETVANAPLAEADGYRDPQRFDPLPTPLTPQGQLPEAMINAVIGSGINHSINADVDEAFGPEMQEDTQPREESLDRETTIPTEIDVPRMQAEQLLPPDPEEGDEVDLPVTGDRDNPIPYTITQLDEENVQFRIALEEGDTVTLHEPWPDASEVTDIGQNDTTIRTTPPQGEGEMITWNEDWGQTTEVLNVTEEEIVLRHSPEVGTTYTQTNPQTGQSSQVEIIDVTEEEIVIERENPHPLAGETLTFIITIEQRQEGSPAPGQPGS